MKRRSAASAPLRPASAEPRRSALTAKIPAPPELKTLGIEEIVALFDTVDDTEVVDVSLMLSGDAAAAAAAASGSRGSELSVGSRAVAAVAKPRGAGLTANSTAVPSRPRQYDSNTLTAAAAAAEAAVESLATHGPSGLVESLRAAGVRVPDMNKMCDIPSETVAVLEKVNDEEAPMAALAARLEALRRRAEALASEAVDEYLRICAPPTPDSLSFPQDHTLSVSAPDYMCRLARADMAVANRIPGDGSHVFAERTARSISGEVSTTVTSPHSQAFLFNRRGRAVLAAPISLRNRKMAVEFLPPPREEKAAAASALAATSSSSAVASSSSSSSAVSTFAAAPSPGLRHFYTSDLGRFPELRAKVQVGREDHSVTWHFARDGFVRNFDQRLYAKWFLLLPFASTPVALPRGQAQQELPRPMQQLPSPPPGSSQQQQQPVAASLNANAEPRQRGIPTAALAGLGEPIWHANEVLYGAKLLIESAQAGRLSSSEPDVLGHLRGAEVSESHLFALFQSLRRLQGFPRAVAAAAAARRVLLDMAARTAAMIWHLVQLPELPASGPFSHSASAWITRDATGRGSDEAWRQFERGLLTRSSDSPFAAVLWGEGRMMRSGLRDLFRVDEACVDETDALCREQPQELRASLQPYVRNVMRDMAREEDRATKAARAEQRKQQQPPQQQQPEAAPPSQQPPLAEGALPPQPPQLQVDDEAGPVPRFAAELLDETDLQIAAASAAEASQRSPEPDQQQQQQQPPHEQQEQQQEKQQQELLLQRQQQEQQKQQQQQKQLQKKQKHKQPKQQQQQQPKSAQPEQPERRELYPFVAAMLSADEASLLRSPLVAPARRVERRKPGPIPAARPTYADSTLGLLRGDVARHASEVERIARVRDGGGGAAAAAAAVSPSSLSSAAAGASGAAAAAGGEANRSQLFKAVERGTLLAAAAASASFADSSWREPAQCSDPFASPPLPHESARLLAAFCVAERAVQAELEAAREAPEGKARDQVVVAATSRLFELIAAWGPALPPSRAARAAAQCHDAAQAALNLPSVCSAAAPRATLEVLAGRALFACGAFADSAAHLQRALFETATGSAELDAVMQVAERRRFDAQLICEYASAALFKGDTKAPLRCSENARRLLKAATETMRASVVFAADALLHAAAMFAVEGQVAQALQLRAEAIAPLVAVEGPAAVDAAELRHLRVLARFCARQPSKAVPYLSELLMKRVRERGESSAPVYALLRLLARVQLAMGDADAAARHLERAVLIAEKWRGPESLEAMGAALALARALPAHPVRAVALLSGTLLSALRVGGVSEAQLAIARLELAAATAELGEVEEAEERLSSVPRAIGGRSTLPIAITAELLALRLFAQRVECEDARLRARLVLVRVLDVCGADCALGAVAVSCAAEQLFWGGHHGHALLAAEMAVAWPGEECWELLLADLAPSFCLATLVHVLEGRGEPARAMAKLAMTRRGGDTSVSELAREPFLAAVRSLHLGLDGRLDEARALLDRTTAHASAQPLALRRHIAGDALLMAGIGLARLKRYTLAAAAMSEARTLYTSGFTQALPQRVARVHCYAADALLAQGRADEALSELSIALRLLEESLQEETSDLMLATHLMGRALSDKGDTAQARQWLQRALHSRERHFGDHPRTADSLFSLAVVSVREGRSSEEAMRLAERCLAMRRRFQPTAQGEAEAVEELIRVLRSLRGGR